MAGGLAKRQRSQLRELTLKFGVSLQLGDFILLDGRWFVTYSGLLRLAYRKGCCSMTAEPVREYCDPTLSRWVFRAAVGRRPGTRLFVAYGEANPGNTSTLAKGCELRIAETRATARALRKAFGIGLCSVDELGSHPFSVRPRNNDCSNGQPRLRDKLCLLIRNYELDPTLVKRYAADFCGTETLREASRDLVEAFVSTISQEAANNRAALVCKLNSYNQPEEVRP